jgi:DNA repair protein SbcC/Rad50
MHITKVELENIKSHVQATFEFQRGTTAITGANGAGKTTIIEAVAWTLFDLLDYKKDDFARRGARTKGTVRVTFESSLDEREYVVYRDTAHGYYVFDPQLKMRIADKKDEVSRFLWQHLGVEAGTDLRVLFRQAVGVPQGTFTSIFTLPPGERKDAFDKLLKVEEYRKSSEELLKTVNFVRNKITAAREKIARAEGELARLETVETEHQAIAANIENLSAEVERLNAEVAEKRAAVKILDEIETSVNDLKNRRDRLHLELTTAEIVLKQKENERRQAMEAAEKLKLVEADYKTHVSALGALKKLETERVERDRVRQQLTKIEKEIISARAERKGCGDNLQKSLEAREKIAALEPEALEETELKKRLEAFRNEQADARAAQRQIETYEGKLKNLRLRLTEINNSIKDTETKSAGAESSEDLQRRESQVTQELARLRAALERDEQFEREIVESLLKNHFCPIFSQKCLNLETGKASEIALAAGGDESRTKIVALESEQKLLSEKLAKSREAEKVAAALPTLYQLKKEVTEEGTRLREEQDGWRQRAANFDRVKTEIETIEARLKALDEPSARIKALEMEARRETETREKIATVEKTLARLESEKSIFGEQLAKFAALDAEWKRLSDERERTSAAHREFLVNEALAKTLPMREAELAEAGEKLSALKTAHEKASAEFEAASQTYDRQRHLSEKAALLEAEKRLAETRATFEAAKRREAELSNELRRLKEIRVTMQAEFKEKERLEKIGEATDFIRETLKEAAPRVARNYVYHVSLEANQMYREITGNAERTLKWAEDYGIVLEENGYDRPFVNLSGGEQMAAALSVRLALLKQLSDVRLAFFDEPTTNMDAARRENLATQIGNIKHFDQLFVISHDDTFEGYVDDIVKVGSPQEIESTG